MKIHAVVVTWNAEDFIAECVASLLAEPEIEAVIVVDNDSSDATATAVSEEFPEVRLIEPGNNGGFSVGCNIGISAAIASGAEAIFLLNPDASVVPGSMALLARALEDDPGLGVAAPKIVSRGGAGSETKLQFIGGSVDPAKGVVYLPEWGEPDLGQHHGTALTAVLSGCSFLVRSSVIEQVGLMDETYFLYWEDTEYSLRLAAAGVPMRVVLDAVVEHDGSRSTRVGGGLIYRYYMERNRLRLMVESGGRSSFGAIMTTLPGYVREFPHFAKMLGMASAWSLTKARIRGLLAFLRHESGRAEGLGS